MWQANHDAYRAGFGHRHRATRQAKTAPRQVDTAQARIAAVHVDGSEIEQRLDSLETKARRLANVASPQGGRFGVDQPDRDQLHALGQIVDAIDTWTSWADGHPVTTAELADAVSLLHDVTRHTPLLATRAGEIDRSRWLELLQPVTAILDQLGLPIRDGVGHELERAGPDLGIDL